jgi:hypothetical protein
MCIYIYQHIYIYMYIYPSHPGSSFALSSIDIPIFDFNLLTSDAAEVLSAIGEAGQRDGL